MRTYTPFTGALAQYGYGPEHRFFDGDPSVAPVGNGGGQSSTPPNPFDAENNPYINAYKAGSSQEVGENNPQSRDPGRSDWGGALQAAGNMAGFALGPFTAAGAVLGNAARGVNSASTGLLDAVGLNPFGQAQRMSDLSYQQSVRDMMGSAMGQTTGSRSQDFFGGINDLGTVGQLGAVLDARDNNREGMPAPGGYSQFSDFTGGDPAGHSAGDGGGMSSADSHGAQADAQGPGNESGMLAKGGYFKGGTGGQEDKVPALLSHGEYVIDAPTVAALGGGNNEAGAKQLDRLREMIRRISHGTPKQPEPVNLKDAFSAAMRGS